MKLMIFVVCLFIILFIGDFCDAAGESIPAFQVTDQELVSIVNEMRNMDENKARRGQIIVDYQGHTNTRDDSDNAPKKFFTKVDASLLRKSTYEQYLSMMNNFNRQTGMREPGVSLNEEKQETSAFLTSVLQSKPWKVLYEFFRQKGHPIATSDMSFRKWVGQLWFDHYSRARGQADTSGFEHIFIGEVKNNEISGMHNWLRLYALEKDPSQSFDYKGFVVKRFNIMAAVKFTWGNELKRSGSILIGSSPEFDMALYTLCFLSRRGRQTCDIEIDGCPLSITSYDIKQNGKVYIGSVFPSAGRITDQCRMRNG